MQLSAQPGILTETVPYHMHVEYSAVSLEEVGHLRRLIQSELKSDEIRQRHVLFGFGRELWNALSPTGVPRSYRPFEQILSHRAVVPSTQGDLWVWFQGDSHAWNLDSACNLDQILQELGFKQKLEVMGFTRFENRDYTGFIDGTENPVDEAAVAAALIEGSGGASFGFTQNWIHNLDAFDQLSLTEQEEVIGRTKADSVELDDDVMPETSHVSRTDATVDGVKQKIVRRSVPHGNLKERGLHFVAFSCDINRIQVQMERMYGVSDDGLHDRLTEFSTPVSGSYWYVPSASQLNQLG